MIMKRILLTLLVILGLGVGMAALQPDAALAASAKDEICGGIGAASGGTGCTAPEGSPNTNTLIETIINILSIIVGVIAVIMIIIAGFQYVTSGGDSSKISSAKNTIIYAVVGLVVVAFSQTIVKFVVQKITS
jgi:hypothetical protein